MYRYIRYCKTISMKTFYNSLFILGGCSEFHFGDKPVSRSAYVAQLEKIGIIVKAQNCLVFQVSSYTYLFGLCLRHVTIFYMHVFYCY